MFRLDICVYIIVHTIWYTIPYCIKNLSQLKSALFYFEVILPCPITIRLHTTLILEDCNQVSPKPSLL